MNDADEQERNPYTAPNATKDAGPVSQPSRTGGRSLLPIVRTSQIIRGALIQGILVILVVFWFTSKENAKADQSMNLLLLGGVVLASTVVASFVVPRMMKPSSTIRPSNELAEAIMTADEKEILPAELNPLLEMYATRSIVIGALLEGGAVANSLFWLLGANMLHVLFVASAIAIMLIRFPTVMGLREFLTHQVRTLD